MEQVEAPKTDEQVDAAVQQLLDQEQGLEAPPVAPAVPAAPAVPLVPAVDEKKNDKDAQLFERIATQAKTFKQPAVDEPVKPEATAKPQTQGEIEKLAKQVSDLQALLKKRNDTHSRNMQRLKSGRVDELEDEPDEPAQPVAQPPVNIEEIEARAAERAIKAVQQQYGPIVQEQQVRKLYDEVRDFQRKFPHYATKDDVEICDKNPAHAEYQKTQEIGTVLKWHRENPDPVIRNASLARAYSIYAMENGLVSQQVAAAKKEGESEMATRMRTAASLTPTLGSVQGAPVVPHVAAQVKNKADLALISKEQLQELVDAVVEGENE